MTKDEILGALPTLEPAELEAIQALIGHLLGAPTGPFDAAWPPAYQITFDALASALGAAISYASIANTKTGALFKKRMPEFTQFLDNHFKGWDGNKVTQIAFLRMLFTLIKDDLEKRNVTPSLGMIVSNMIRIHSVFDGAFPGYLEAGAGHLILGKFK